MDGASLFWAAAVIVFVIAEAATAALVSLWFIGGSAAALIAALLGAPIWAQVVLFFAVSGLLLALLRPLAKRNAGQRVATNADRVIGASAIVTETINDLQGTGAVKIDGKEWSARSCDGAIIEVGSVVRIDRIEGVKVFAKKEEVSQ